MNAPPVVVATELHKSFEARGRMARRVSIPAVRGVSFVVGHGETLGVVGESGSGKSTVANMITGLLRPTSGSVYFGQVDLATLRGRALRRHRRNVQVVFQDPYGSFEPTTLLGASLAEPMVAHRIGNRRSQRQRIEEVLGLVGLPAEFAERRPSQLSGGQLQRASIARALTIEPALLVLDEPVSALDVSTKAEIINLLTDLRQRLGLSLLVISHDLSTLRVVADRLAVMYLGEIVEQGPAEAIYSAPAHPYTRALLDAVPVANPVVQQGRRRVQITGEIPSIDGLPTGCPFHPRCAEAMEICSTVVPSRRNHLGVTVACHLYPEQP